MSIKTVLLMAELFDLIKSLKKKSLIYDFLFPIVLIADLYEFNTNNCLQASRSKKFCVCLSYSLSECTEATQTCLPEEVSFQVRSPELKST